MVVIIAPRVNNLVGGVGQCGDTCCCPRLNGKQMILHIPLSILARAKLLGKSLNNFSPTHPCFQKIAAAAAAAAAAVSLVARAFVAVEDSNF